MSQKMKIFITTLLIIIPVWLLAQEVVIQGKVTDENNEPLPGANVLIRLTTLGAAADVNGNYKFTVPAKVAKGQEVTLEARFIGYRTKRTKVVLKPGTTITQNFVMEEDVLNMDAIIVTGVVDETPKAKMAFSVAKVSSELLEEVQPISPEAALYGKVAGVRVVRGAGQPGTPASVQLRAPTSINASGRSQDPLYIVDGVIIDPSVEGSPMTDIPADEIESIEIVKGASGASLYGARAANGVIRITTKRGNHLGIGETRIKVTNQFGANGITKKLKMNMHHGWKIFEGDTPYTDANGHRVEPGDFIDNDGNWVDPREPGARVPDTYRDPNEVPHASGIEFFDNPYKYVATGVPGQGEPELLKKPFDQIDRFFGAGQYIRNTISVSQNTEKTNFLVSFSNYQQAGIVEGIDGLVRRSVRLNLDHKFKRKFNISFSGLFSQTKRDLIDAGRSDPLFALTFMAPDADLAKIDPSTGRLFIQPDPTSVEDNPLYFIRYNDRDGTRQRIMGSFSGRWAPVDWFNLEGNISYDRSNRRNERFWPIGYLSISPGPEINGRFIIGDVFDEALNGSLTASFAKQFGDLVVRVKGRGLFERTERKFEQGDGIDLAVQGVRSLSVANQELSFVDSEIRQIRSTGYSFITALDYKDRYILDFHLRWDGSSLFGPEERWNTYFRISGAYRMAQEPWWFLPFFQEFKPRASFGTAGGRPNFFARFETFSVSAGRVTKQTLGNKALKPEDAEELEIGLDTAFLNRFTLELSFAKSTVKDQLLEVPLPSFTGFATQWRNAGTLDTQVLEATLNASLVQKRSFSWTAGLTFDRTFKQKITQLNQPAFRIGPFFIKEGEDLGAMYGDKWVTSLDELPPGIPREQFQVNDDGYVVWVGEGNSFKDGIAKSLWGLSTTMTDEHGVDHSYKWGMPILFLEEEFDEDTGEFTGYNPFVRLGDVIPDFNFGINSTLRYKGITFYVLMDAQIGGKIYNNTRQWGLRELKLGEADQFGKPDELKKPGAYYAVLYDVNAVNSHFVEDATYLKIRELRLSYSFNRSQLKGIFGGLLNKLTIGFVGENLFTFTGYKGYDPEVGLVFGELGSSVISRYDAHGYPNFRTFSGLIEFEF
ncbi:MAG: SusC/RagA family TonB-linked outer membrane protein [Calditrichaeota bacterium]|nr:MAG: SusC/RagA family TonB-linked outer membrane protein [Calditrichota bacterium]